jgi:hypothetical protein
MFDVHSIQFKVDRLIPCVIQPKSRPMNYRLVNHEALETSAVVGKLANVVTRGRQSPCRWCSGQERRFLAAINRSTGCGKSPDASGQDLLSQFKIVAGAKKIISDFLQWLRLTAATRLFVTNADLT